MTREIQNIPISPREPRWALVFWYRWPLLRTGCAFIVLGSLWTWMLYLGHLGGQHFDQELDSYSRPANAVVTQLESEVRSFGGQMWDRVHYDLPDEGPKAGSCFIPSGQVEVGSTYPAQVHSQKHREHINRLVGGRRYLIPWWARPDLYLGLIVAPGLLLLMLWAAGAMEIRRLLADGDVAIAEVTDSRSIGVAPPMLLVSFRYRDHHAQIHTGRHRVRTQSELGIRLRRGEHRFPAIVHRRFPRAARLVVASDFEPTSAAAASSDPANMET